MVPRVSALIHEGSWWRRCIKVGSHQSPSSHLSPLPQIPIPLESCPPSSLDSPSPPLLLSSYLPFLQCPSHPFSLQLSFTPCFPFSSPRSFSSCPPALISHPPLPLLPSPSPLSLHRLFILQSFYCILSQEI